MRATREQQIRASNNHFEHWAAAKRAANKICCGGEQNPPPEGVSLARWQGMIKRVIKDWEENDD